MHMLPPHTIPLLLSVLVGLIVSLTVWGFVRGRSQEIAIALPDRPEALLWAMLALALFAMAAFLTYLLLTIGRI
jgi:hypothetical protein